MLKILIGSISGIISGTGMGGGTILIFLLVYMLGIEQHIAQATNLIFFVPTSIMAIIINLKNKNIELQTAILISVFGILGAIIRCKYIYKNKCQYFKKMFWDFFSNCCYS